MTTQYSCFWCGRDISEETSNQFQAITFEGEVGCFCSVFCRTENLDSLFLLVNKLQLDNPELFLVPIDSVRDNDFIVAAVDREGNSMWGDVHDSTSGHIYGGNVHWVIELENDETRQYKHDYPEGNEYDSCPNGNEFNFGETTAMAWIRREHPVLNEKLELCSWFVNVYEVDRHYGGPEEGGWWYDSGTLQLTVPCVRYEPAQEVQENLRKVYPTTGKSSSVVYDGGDYSVHLSQNPGKDYPERRPHYS